ncbi:MAG: hypothetical protein SCM11_10540 [Bacillota bacterium]|nr:hypothetical protein [Bacillota bacterium]
MPIGLGIDTGGTYTDGALYHFDDRQILQTGKALTRKEDLTACDGTGLGRLAQPD